MYEKLPEELKKDGWFCLIPVSEFKVWLSARATEK